MLNCFFGMANWLAGVILGQSEALRQENGDTKT
jgi:hypothetical protein